MQASGYQPPTLMAAWSQSLGQLKYMASSLRNKMSPEFAAIIILQVV